MRLRLLSLALAVLAAQTVTLIDCRCGLFCARKNACTQCERPPVPDC
jgi:hypothetical protein